MIQTGVDETVNLSTAHVLQNLNVVFEFHGKLQKIPERANRTVFSNCDCKFCCATAVTTEFMILNTWPLTTLSYFCKRFFTRAIASSRHLEQFETRFEEKNNNGSLYCKVLSPNRFLKQLAAWMSFSLKKITFVTQRCPIRCERHLINHCTKLLLASLSR